MTKRFFFAVRLTFTKLGSSTTTSFDVSGDVPSFKTVTISKISTSKEDETFSSI